MTYRNPPTAVDVIIEVWQKDKTNEQKDKIKGIVLIQRGREPYKGCWALPGGFQEYGETLEEAAVREAKEETGLDICILGQLKVHSEPDRDPRGHVNSVGYVATAQGIPKGGDDAKHAQIFPTNKPMPDLAFDHKKRIEEYLGWKQTEY